MDALVWEGETPQLRSPVLICAFAGWNDAAGSATTALTTAAESLDAEVVAQIDPEEFFDFQANRPTIRLSEGQSREIEWPGNVFLAAKAEGAERDLILLAGTEPNLRWRTFSDGVAEAAESMGVEMVITLGALIADVAHTLPVPITGLASDPDMVERLSLSQSSYEGPTGVVGVVHDACQRRGIPSASLWAAIPHYVAAVPNPKAALALLRRLEGLVGVAVDATELEEESESYERQVTNAVSANPEIQEVVQRLEAEQAEQLEMEENLPSGETLAREFEQFLRQRGGGPPQGP
ncbi:MAG TPA: PAC2 family protein [Solirubrobacterales bacterium]|jgi:predicted ATP-grasp superfamily ATP-dependent carboligase|nr:PAC2 family protein [Solirubrobacterales bacterium]